VRRAVFVLVVATLACGARSSLEAAGERGGPLGPGGAAGHSQGGEGGSQGGAAGQGGTPYVACEIVSAGAPVELVSFPEGNAASPDLALLAPGSSDTSARILHQAVSAEATVWHPDLRVVDYDIGISWPGGVAAGHEPASAGADAHAGGRLAEAPWSPGTAALLWYHGDEASPAVQPGVKFRTLDGDTLAGGPEIFVDEDGEQAYALAPGMSVGGSDEGYLGDGYGAAWRHIADDQGHVSARVAVLAADGSVAAGPVAATPSGDYPGRSVDLAWSGSRYVVAVSHDAVSCTGGDPPCAASSVMALELAPPGVVDAHLEARATIPATAGLAPFRPRLARSGERLALAWSEALDMMAPSPRIVRVALLDGAGALLAEPTTLAHDVPLIAPLSVGAGELGFVVAWIERGDMSLPPSVPGFARLVAWHLSPEGVPDRAPVVIDVTDAQSNLAVVTILAPRAALVSWAGARAGGGSRVTYLARLDCNPLR
jgi:hypothetical protein